MKHGLLALLTLSTLSVPVFANVIVTSPKSGDTITSSATFQATATTSTCSKGVASMGVYVDNRLEYIVDGTNLQTTLPLSVGRHATAVQEWDFCGGASLTPVAVNVADKTGVWVTQPVNNSTVNWLTNYVATATTSCASGVAAMGVYVGDRLTYVSQGAKLDTQINLAPGAARTVVQEWDNCGGSATTPINLTVTGQGNTFSNLQASPAWSSWGQKMPDYSDCDFPCTGVTWAMKQNVQSPSLSGNATQFSLAGTQPYSDVLFANHLIGDFSSQGLPDRDRTIVPKAHNFTYDGYFFVTNSQETQAVEFDINWFADSIGMTWGTECRIRGGNEWDIWDNVGAKWVPTGIGCHVIENGWNHVTVTAQRLPDNTLLYQSISLNGVTSNINKVYAPFTVPSNWYGITVNYQLDGDEKQASISSYVDKLSFMYW